MFKENAENQVKLVRTVMKDAKVVKYKDPTHKVAKGEQKEIARQLKEKEKATEREKMKEMTDEQKREYRAERKNKTKRLKRQADAKK